MKRKFLILFIISISFQNINAQYKVEQLIGTWESYETEEQRKKREQNVPITEPIGSKKKSKPIKIVLNFYRKDKMEYNANGYGDKAKYKLKNSVLILGTRKYSIIKLTDSILVLRSDLFTSEEYYRKIENDKATEKE